MMIELGKVDTPNVNGRTYPHDEMIDALTRKPTLYAVFGDSQTYSLDMQRITAEIHSFHIEKDGTVTARAKCLDTPNGKLLRALTEGGMKHDYRFFGTGDVDENGVVTNYSINGVAILPYGIGA